MFTTIFLITLKLTLYVLALPALLLLLIWQTSGKARGIFTTVLKAYSALCIVLGVGLIPVFFLAFGIGGGNPTVMDLLLAAIIRTAPLFLAGGISFYLWFLQNRYFLKN
ncbi:hypothetical protein [uncultured Ruegeria sp.]|uniref:hypothetical protein n=1 Tax=uncultured Ruegeria sp. TaxID=259304 RepID=UPI0026114BFB|nr:hypothetical protein [uncultured Ruegeria sp.]